MYSDCTVGSGLPFVLKLEQEIEMETFICYNGIILLFYFYFNGII